ncbi:MAG TPA: BTAD domain-containing putative transcriptional regulator, partial [Caldilineaceae bacterium]|nr:BTAD domain-containing putative transcriptional regulator [Caldilineaceae bacterium]
MSTLQLFLLGPPRVELAQQSVAIPRRKAQALLFFLAVTGVAQPRATLGTLLWPGHNQQQAHGSLRRHLSELNLLLGHDCLVGDRESVRLAQTASLWLDVAEFHQAVAQCQTHGHPPYDVCRVCLTPLTRATTLYRDDFLTGFTLPACPAFDEWQFFQTETHRQILATALERLVHLHMDQNEPDTALTYARRRLPLDPLHEPAHRQLMRLYAATGQLAAAIRQYERCVRTLWEELEAPPEAETVALYEQIRRGRGQASRSTETGSAGNVPLRAPGEALSPPRLAPALAHNLPVQTTLF